AMFIERNLDLAMQKGMVAMITMQSWMFLSSFEKLRESILNNDTILSLAHLGPRAFDSISGEVVSTTAFVFETEHHENLKGVYLRLIGGRNEAEKEAELKAKRNEPVYASSADFKKIPGSPIAYWVSEKVRDIFKNATELGRNIPTKKGMDTGDNDKFLRFWQEVSLKRIGINLMSGAETIKLNKKWVPYNKGGDFKKWYGNNEYVINWENDGENLKKSTANLRSKHLYFKNSITWNALTSSKASARFSDYGALFDSAGSSMFPMKDHLYFCLSFMNSNIVDYILRLLNPTLNYGAGTVGKLPIIPSKSEQTKQNINHLTQQNIDISREEWDSRETSWDFTINELLRHKTTNRIEDAYNNYCTYWKDQFSKLHTNEEELNRIFIDIYDLADELTPDVPLKDITILKDESEIKDGELVFKKEMLVKQFISYSVGCMFGRYSPDREGLILANQGETIDDFREKVPDASFMPDEDNIIPILEDEYFTDDIVGRFKEFLKATFGAESLAENLEFIAGALSKSKKGSVLPEKVIRDYFLKSFFKDHVKTYKKRPIYWLFTSGKGRGFNALVYMHRYNRETLAKMRTDYLLELEAKLDARIGMLGDESAAEKGRLGKQIEELAAYDEVLHNKSLEYIDIDLDDGVKVNYAKFEGLVGKI
ncbi:MAG: BREX-1 system adenine-specific DNA-methyltransferase PglX, partial [Thermodesulfobacteriota bacterium]|nr:BREX-1 system adenine-specific DNA-methyltransferase PglX [Thermodesulfobacteriota bacterium]